MLPEYLRAQEGADLRIYRRRVAGTGRAEVLVSDRVPLDEPALEILEWRKTVLVTKADGVLGGVLLAGRVRTRCLYITTGPAARVLCQVAEIPFECHVRVRGARPGAEVRVTEAYVTADASERTVCDSGGLVSAVLDRSLIEINLRVVQPEFGLIHTSRLRTKRGGKAAKVSGRADAKKAKGAGGARVSEQAPAPPAPPTPPAPPAAPRYPGVWVHPDALVPGT